MCFASPCAPSCPGARHRSRHVACARGVPAGRLTRRLLDLRRPQGVPDSSGQANAHPNHTACCRSRTAPRRAGCDGAVKLLAELTDTAVRRRLLRRCCSRGAGICPEQVFVFGTGNSAGRPAMHLAQYTAKVTVTVRGDSLAANMSDYLVQDLGALRTSRSASGSRWSLHGRTSAALVSSGTTAPGRDHSD